MNQPPILPLPLRPPLATTLIGLALAATALPVAADPSSVWVEGEQAKQKSVRHNGWYEGLDEGMLSGGAALANWGGPPATASYEVEISAAGTYQLWLRANPVSSRLSVKVGDGESQEVNFKGDALKHEHLNIAADRKIDLRFLTWVKAGEHKLSPGTVELAVRFESGNNHHGILDCFCLTTDRSWEPRRTSKPGQQAPDWKAPKITDGNLDRWIAFVRPGKEELAWREVRWHTSLSEAAAESRKLQRPILLWAMNGHPCGET